MREKLKREFDRLESVVTQKESKNIRFDRKTHRISNHLKLLNELLKMRTSMRLIFD